MSKKAAGKKMTEMDPSIREEVNGTVHVNNTRVCWALKTLVAEVLELFPETPVEYSNPDGRNTQLDVTFDLSSMDEDERLDFTTLMALLGDPAYNEDPRIREVVVDDSEDATDATTPSQVLVGMKANPRTQDSREPFGLGDALLVLSGDETP